MYFEQCIYVYFLPLDDSRFSYHPIILPVSCRVGSWRESHPSHAQLQVVLEANTSLLKRSGNCLNELQDNFEAEMEQFNRVRTSEQDDSNKTFCRPSCGQSTKVQSSAVAPPFVVSCSMLDA